MAKQESRFKNMKVIGSTLKTINSLMDGIYKATYNSDRNSMDSINKATKDIEDSIANIISRNNMADISNMSKLYTRMKLNELGNDKDLVEGVKNFFEDPLATQSLLSIYTENRWIKDLDAEYDAILKYMPRLAEALKAKKECVLSSDNFSKTFLNESSRNISEDTDHALFASRMEQLKEKFKSQAFFEETYDNTSKYGEDFIYCVPYSRAIGDLLKRKGNTRNKTPYGYSSFSESVTEISIIENGVINNTELYESVQEACVKNNIKFTMPDNFKVIIDNSGVLQSAYEEQTQMIEKMETSPKSIYESILEAGGTENFKFDSSLPDNLELPKDFNSDKTSSDGFISTNKPVNVKIPGAVLKRLKHENIIPLYIDQTCLGYYYIEFLGSSSYESLMNHDQYGKNNIFTGNNIRNVNMANQTMEDQKNKLLAHFASNIANNIDDRFANSNQDLAKEIYNILYFNDIFNTQFIDSIRISFLPESDVEHVFFKQDPKTHRGISDLANALIPAKLYCSMYITYALGTLTRGFDKRVYYVKQNVEQNIAQTMLNVINQIKRGNFGMREIENMNTVLNITGRYNDYIIPVGPSGDSPVQFEVMQGQDINPQTDFMTMLEEMAINSTDMPIEFIQNRMQSLDFAVQATSVNAKVARSTFNRQALLEPYLGRIQTKLYNSEYGTNITISCSLPIPVFLHLSNMNQMFQNMKEHVQAIADYEYEAETAAGNPNADAEKAIFIRRMMRKNLSTYLKLNEIEEHKALAKLELSKIKKEEQ
jgi:hypothetical protein